MHKDKPPGLFDFAERSIAHAIRMGLAIGVGLGVIAQAGLTIWRADSAVNRPKLTAEDAEAKTRAHRKPDAPTPPPSADVKY